MYFIKKTRETYIGKQKIEIEEKYMFVNSIYN